MSFEAVLHVGNKEFEFVVSEVTLTVVNKAFSFWTWCISTSVSDR